MDSPPERSLGVSPDSGRTGDILAGGREFDWPKDSLCRMYSPGDQGADCEILTTRVVPGFLSLLGKAVAFALGVCRWGLTLFGDPTVTGECIRFGDTRPGDPTR